MNIVGRDEVKQFIVSYLDQGFKESSLKQGDITDDFDIMKGGVVDSIGFIELLSAIEKHFGITVDFEAMDTENLTVIGPLCRYIEEFATKPTNDV